MGMIEVKKDFTRRELLWFGPLFALFAGIIGAIAVLRFDAARAAWGIWGVAAVLIWLYYLIPPIREPLYRGWIYAVLPIGWVVSHVVLAVVYYLILTPIGLLMRLCGYDPMHRRFDMTAETYWVQRDVAEHPKRYFRQF